MTNLEKCNAGIEYSYADEELIANNTYQVKNYANFELGGFSEEAKRKYREEHWQQDLQNAFDFGKTMAEKIIGC